ncbi:MAG: type VI secretion system tube protein Hcp [Burkholderia sp.]
MDLILLQPGDPGVLGAAGSMNDGTDGLVGGPTGVCIEIVSLQQGIKQTIAADLPNGARTSGRPILTELTLVKYLDGHSPTLYDHCLRAAPLGHGADQPTMLYLMRNTDDQTFCQMKIALRDAIVSDRVADATERHADRTVQTRLHRDRLDRRAAGGEPRAGGGVERGEGSAGECAVEGPLSRRAPTAPGGPMAGLPTPAMQAPAQNACVSPTRATS